MSIKKFELTTETKIVSGTKYFRIKALISFGNVKAGDLGGWVEKEENLAQVSGNAWVYGDAWVSGNAWVMWISKIGSSLGTLTVFTNKEGGVTVTRGCFIGSLAEFEKDVKERHHGNSHAKEYEAAIRLIKLRFADSLKNKNKEVV